MKKSILLAVLLMFVVPMVAQAETVQVKDSHFFHSHNREVTVHNKTEDRYEEFDYGPFLDLILFETKDKNYKLVSKTDYQIQREEWTTLLGAQINVWSIFTGSKE